MAADVEVAAINSPSDGAGEGGEGGGEGGGDGDGGNSLRCDEAAPESEPMETDTPAREQSLADSPTPSPPRPLPAALLRPPQLVGQGGTLIDAENGKGGVGMPPPALPPSIPASLCEPSVGPEPGESVWMMGPPPPPPVLPPPMPPPAARPQRERKRKERYGDNGELDGGPASGFRSAPPPRKPSIAPELEMGVPAYALPGEEVWAMGLHAGQRKRFRAEVTSLRTQFPRIVVKYTAYEDGGTAAIALPEMRTAYLCAADVQPRDW